MVEEIVERYLAARPRRQRRQRWACAGAAALLLFGGWRLWQGMLDRVDQRLLEQISQVQRSVSQQVNGIAAQVQDILDRQNSLLAESGAEVAGYDFTDGPKGSVRFSLYAVPKSYQEGTTAAFTAESGGEIRTAEGTLTEGRRFSAELTYPLTDETVTLSVAFTLPDGTVETQRLNAFGNLLTWTLPSISVGTELYRLPVKDGSVSLSGQACLLLWCSEEERKSTSASVTDADSSTPEIRSVRLGLFRNRKLIAWAEPCEKPAAYLGGYAFYHFARLPECTVPMEAGDLLCAAALVEDVYGRQFLCATDFFTSDNPYGDGSLDYGAASLPSVANWDPSDWQF